jgi:hypothetical protein
MMLALLSTPAWAQTTAHDRGEVDPPQLHTHEDVTVVETYVPEHADRVADKAFLLVGSSLMSAMLLDTKSTFDAFSRCTTCYEANPYAAPFVNRGPAVAFTAGVAFDIGVMTIAAKMKGSDNPVLRRIWWVAPVALTTGHLLAYRHNGQVAR